MVVVGEMTTTTVLAMAVVETSGIRIAAVVAVGEMTTTAITSRRRRVGTTRRESELVTTYVRVEWLVAGPQKKRERRTSYRTRILFTWATRERSVSSNSFGTRVDRHVLSERCVERVFVRYVALATAHLLHSAKLKHGGADVRGVVQTSANKFKSLRSTRQCPVTSG